MYILLNILDGTFYNVFKVYKYRSTYIIYYNRPIIKHYSGIHFNIFILDNNAPHNSKVYINKKKLKSYKTFYFTYPVILIYRGLFFKAVSLNCPLYDFFNITNLFNSINYNCINYPLFYKYLQILTSNNNFPLSYLLSILNTVFFIKPFINKLTYLFINTYNNIQIKRELLK
jgi:hypothetical protein